MRVHHTQMIPIGSLGCPTPSTPSWTVCLSNSGTCRDWCCHHRQICSQKTKTIPVVTRRGCDPCTPSSPRSMEYLEADDVPGPLPGHTLRRHGLPDSSIHSTFMNQGGNGNESNHCPVEPAGPRSERRSALRTPSRTVQNFIQVVLLAISGVAHASNSVTSSHSAPGQSDSFNDSLNIRALSRPESVLQHLSPKYQV